MAGQYGYVPLGTLGMFGPLHFINNYIRFCNTQMEIYAGHVTCCPLVSRVEYAPCARLRLEKKDDTDGQTDGRQTVTLHLPLDSATI